MSKIAFKPEEATDALKEYGGQIVATDYSEEPFGMKGAPDIKRTGKVLAIQIKTDAYEKLQYEWYPPSRVKKTKAGIVISFQAWGGDWQVYSLYRLRQRPLIQAERDYPVVKWLFFIEALNTTGAMRDVSIAGKDDEERMQSLAKSLLGMTFRFEEREFESMVRIKGGDFKRFSVLIPIEYLGKKPIEAVPEVKQTTIGEATAKPTGAVD